VGAKHCGHAELNEDKRGVLELKPIRILVDSFADADLPNAQMGNAREIVRRLDPARFHVSMFALGRPDPRIVARENTRLIQLPQRRQTVRILREFLCGAHQVLFYMKASPASRWYLSLRKRRSDRRTTIGTVESQSDLRSKDFIPRETVCLWEQTVLRCDRLFSNSQSVQKSLGRQYGLQSEIIPTGVDTKFFTPSPARPPNSRPQVLFVGSLRTYKHPHIIVDAAARFPQADFRIAGEGPLAAELRNRITTERLKNVEFLGLLKAEALRSEYQNADIFLFPSCWEGSPKVILEAAACGLPVIARSDYSPETILHGTSGYQAASDESIFAHLEELLRSPALREQLGRNGRKLSEKYDWGAITAQWEEAFTHSLAERELRNVS
jgi:glycosyltransferase involved in cell wall biosynthesis